MHVVWKGIIVTAYPILDLPFLVTSYDGYSNAKEWVVPSQCACRGSEHNDRRVHARTWTQETFGSTRIIRRSSSVEEGSRGIARKGGPL